MNAKTAAQPKASNPTTKGNTRPTRMTVGTDVSATKIRRLAIGTTPQANKEGARPPVASFESIVRHTAKLMADRGHGRHHKGNRKPPSLHEASPRKSGANVQLLVPGQTSKVGFAIADRRA